MKEWSNADKSEELGGPTQTDDHNGSRVTGSMGEIRYNLQQNVTGSEK